MEHKTESSSTAATINGSGYVTNPQSTRATSPASFPSRFPGPIAGSLGTPSLAAAMPEGSMLQRLGISSPPLTGDRYHLSDGSIDTARTPCKHPPGPSKLTMGSQMTREEQSAFSQVMGGIVSASLNSNQGPTIGRSHGTTSAEARRRAQLRWARGDRYQYLQATNRFNDEISSHAMGGSCINKSRSTRSRRFATRPRRSSGSAEIARGTDRLDQTDPEREEKAWLDEPIVLRWGLSGKHLNQSPWGAEIHQEAERPDLTKDTVTS